MNHARIWVLALLLPLLSGPAHAVTMRSPARGSKPTTVAFKAPLSKTGGPSFAALTARPQASLESLLKLAKDGPKVNHSAAARPPQASFLLDLLTDPKLITENREFFTAAIGQENAQTIESTAKAIAKESKKDQALARFVKSISDGTYFSRNLRVRQAADLLGVWFDGSSIPKNAGLTLGESLTAAVSNLRPAGAPKANPSLKPKRTPSLLGRPKIADSLKGVSKERFDNPFYHNARGKLRSIEYGSPVSRTMGRREVHALSYPYREDGKLEIDLLVQNPGRGPNKVKTVLISTLKKTDFPSFKQYWLEGGMSGRPPIKVPSKRANRYLLGWPQQIKGKNVLVEVSGQEYWFDLEKIYLANLYQPDNSLETLRQLAEAGGEGYILRADYFKKNHGEEENPAYYFGELVVVTQAPDPDRKPDPVMKGGERKLSLFHKPGFKAAMEELDQMGVKVAFGDYEGISGVYLPQRNEATKFLKKRFPELRRGKLGMIFLSAKDTLDTLHHEKSHALDRIHLFPKFVEAFKALEKKHGELTEEQVSTIWGYLTEQRAYTESYLQLKKEGRLKPQGTFDFEPTAQGTRRKMNDYKTELTKVLSKLSPQLRVGIIRALSRLIRPELTRIPQFSLPERTK